VNDTSRTDIIYSLVEGLCKNGWVGKTHVQKAVYLLQEAGEVDLGFRYVIHHYGPYSFELYSFMQNLSYLEVLSITRENDGYGYEVTTGARNDSAALDPRTKKVIDATVENLGGLSASDLELLATCQYITSRFDARDTTAQAEEVRKLKPKFTLGRIRKGIAEAADLQAVLRSV